MPEVRIADDPRRWTADEVVARLGVARAIGIKKVAAILFTYRCTIACEHCLFSCGPGMPDVVCSVEDGVEWLRQLRTTDRIIHIAGGEAMMYWDRLLDLCRAAAEEGVAPHFIESNASWAASDAAVRERYRQLADCGLRGILLSADPYHQVFVPPARRRRAYEWAVEQWGVENVAASGDDEARLAEMREIGRDEDRLGEYTRRHPPMLLGRAGDELARFFPDRPIDELAGERLWPDASEGMNCRNEFDAETIWEIHIDPYGNIQTNCGIVLGNARVTPLPDVIRAGIENANEIVGIVAGEGPVGLLRHAEGLGYRRRAGYKQKCHLCWEVRKFLRAHYPDILGPAEPYGDSRPGTVPRPQRMKPAGHKAPVLPDGKALRKNHDR